MQVRTSVLVMVGASFGLIVAMAAFAIARHHRDELPSPFVHPSQHAAMRAAAEDEARRDTAQATPGVAETSGESAAQLDRSAAQLDREDAMIDDLAGVLNGDPARGANASRASDGAGGNSGAISLPPSGVAVAPTRSDTQRVPTGEQPVASQWQVPYADDFDSEWGIGGYGGWGLPLTYSDFVQNPAVVNSGQQAQLGQQAAPGSVQRPVQAQPQVRETPPGGAVLSAPAPGAANTADNIQDAVPPPAPPQGQQSAPPQQQPAQQAPPQQAPPGNTVR